MKVRVSYKGSLRSTLSDQDEEVELSDDATLRVLLRRLNERHGKSFKANIFDAEDSLWIQTAGIDENLNEGDEWNALVRLNETPIHRLRGLNSSLKNGDHVTINLIFSGGG